MFGRVLVLNDNVDCECDNDGVHLEWKKKGCISP